MILEANGGVERDASSLPENRRFVDAPSRLRSDPPGWSCFSMERAGQDDDPHGGEGYRKPCSGRRMAFIRCCREWRYAWRWLSAQSGRGARGRRGYARSGPIVPACWDSGTDPSRRLPTPRGIITRDTCEAARDRADGMAKQSADSSGPAGDAGETERVASRDDLDATGTPSGSSPSRTAETAASSAPVRDDGLRVTLGPPEPLPALSHPAPLASPDTALASNMSPVPAKRDRPSPEAVAEPKSTADSALDSPGATRMMLKTVGNPMSRSRSPHRSGRRSRQRRLAKPRRSWPRAETSWNRSPPTRSRSRGPSGSTNVSCPRNRSS